MMEYQELYTIQWKKSKKRPKTCQKIKFQIFLKSQIWIIHPCRSLKMHFIFQFMQQFLQRIFKDIGTYLGPWYIIWPQPGYAPGGSAQNEQILGKDLGYLLPVHFLQIQSPGLKKKLNV